MKLWSGRFTKPSNSLSNDFNASIDIDKRMWKQDIKGSIAHAKMLAKQGILSAADTELIISGLEAIYGDLEAGSIDLTPEKYEDIHMAVEEILTERIGEAGKHLHTARSRNDQVATDFRLFVMDAINEIEENIAVLMESLAIKAKEYETAVMPGFTHLQKAQPVLLSHHLLAYHNMFSRDMDRFEDCKKRADCMPLGSGALAGTSYDTDREYLAAELGFSKISSNSMDAVSDRDFAIEFLSCASQCMMHLSRFCEEIIFWNTSDVGFIEIDDAFATGSSIMPQKKNHMPVLTAAKVYGIPRGTLRVWIKRYREGGVEALNSKKLHTGNHFAALHTSKSLTEHERLLLLVEKLQIENERLKKGYTVKGVGAGKEFVTLKDLNSR